MVRVALIGYGAVASLHARALVALGADVHVWGPDPDKRERFAAACGVAAGTTLHETFALADAAVIASPSQLHMAHAISALDGGCRVLVEIPVAEDGVAGRQLGDIARRRGLVVRAAHTARYLPAVRTIGRAVADGDVGTVKAVRYERTIVLPARSWRDDVVRHHAFHAVDLVHALGIVATPVRARVVEDGGAPVAVSATLTGDDVSVEIDVRYSGSRPAAARLAVIGSHGTIESDTFSWVMIDGAEVLRCDSEEAYRDAIAAQDSDFLQALAGEAAGVEWAATVAVTDVIDEIAALAANRAPHGEAPGLHHE